MIKAPQIPIFSVQRQNILIGQEIKNAISEVLGKGAYILGEKVSEFEDKFAEYIGVKYAVGVASGTDAIRLALLSLGINQGDEVIMPANSYPSVFGVIDSGAKPVLVDINPSTFNINPDLIEDAITRKTKAIMPVHLYGNPAEMEKIMEIADRHNLTVVEDCAQAAGAMIRVKGKGLREKKCGSVGKIGCFSFYPTKNLGAFGDGGMIVTDGEEIYKKARLWRMYGEEKRYRSVLAGKNSRLDELEAAILLVKLKYLDKWNERRRQIASKYQSIIISGSCRSSIPNYDTSPFGSPSLASPVIKKNVPFSVPTTYNLQQTTKEVFHLFVVRSKKRDELKSFLEKEGIVTGIHYPCPIHLQPSMAYLGYKKGDFPESERVSDEVLSLPIWPEMTDTEAEHVAGKVLDFAKNHES